MTRCRLPPFETVVSNLPYSVSSTITFRLLDVGFNEGVLMYQSEFADRMVAPPGSKDCGRLSVMVQTYAAVRPCFKLPPSCFSPKPQVHSTVVRMIPREPEFPINDRGLYADLVRALFSHRRKIVRNCLKGSARQHARADLGGPGSRKSAREDPHEPARETVLKGFCDHRKYFLNNCNCRQSLEFLPSVYSKCAKIRFF